jgi:hypothetical protein
MKKPDLTDSRNDDTSYRYDLNRISPHHYLNTLKAYNLMPAAKDVPRNMFMMKTGTKFMKYRRLSHNKINLSKNGFSTNNRLPAQEEEMEFYNRSTT